MRRRRLKAYWQRLGELQRQRPARDALLKKLGAAQERAGRIATSLVTVEVAPCAAAKAAICSARTSRPTIRS